ncbi:T9SS type A sorting domain-containing protein [Rhodocytophaga rosea]|uniref:T9SS type A sorting domain-containing protein n=1 Tax=Rhodocytophaga rosea TaxID=2704465 RepID=A0A6C0GML4_9BACT|nr:MBG domain-containing protein [Rhodocytophaga rosea]QHT69177.1 T9SS type A sorting domain-containing protein [Rhodocytophaga rosea]
MSLFTFTAYSQQESQPEINGKSIFIQLPAKVQALGTKPAQELLREYLQLSQSHTFQPLGVQADPSGFSHNRFQQYYKGIPVEYGIYNLHVKNGTPAFISGEQYTLSEINTTPALSEQQAFQKALQFVHANKYAWQTADKAPKGELVICKVFLSEGRRAADEMALAYKFDIFATEPLSRAFIYVDAQTGKVIHKDAIIKHATGTAATRYSGNRTIGTEKNGNSYRLRDFSRGLGIETYTMKNGTDYTIASDVTDTDNNWTAAEFDNATKDNAALDAHWGAMMTYDYFNTVHNRNSFDGNGAKIKNYVHYSSNYSNAFWNGSVMTYGDGGTMGNIIVQPFTSLDITAHEIGHALCQHTANLVYANESGALNEAFSDIWGAMVEQYAAPEKDMWSIGEDINYTIRSMSNPNIFEHPDTYLGQYWYSGSGDNGGVHINSGVLNHWFYILSIGKSGMNDNGDSYTVTGIGIDKAAKIAFRTESIYLTANSKYADTRVFSIQAAIDLYGANSKEAIQTANAWFAVGVYDIQSAPSNLTATAISGTQINLSWTDNSNNETGFSIERSTMATTGFVPIATVEANATSFQNTNLPTDAVYYYRIATLNGNTRSVFSNTANASVGKGPVIMSNATIVTCQATFMDAGGLEEYSNNQLLVTTFTPAAAGNKIQVNFTAFSTEGGYDYLKVYDGASTSAPLLGTYSGNTLPPVITATNDSGQLTFRFTSDGVVTGSGWQANITCVEVPATPSNLTATAISGTQINLSWTDNSNNETGFSIERSTMATTGFVPIATVEANATSFQNTNLPTDVAYYYRVRAEKNALFSLYSNTASAIIGSLPISMSNTSLTLCQGTLLDPGGSGRYGNSLNVTMTLAPSTAGHKIRISFSSFSTEQNQDVLKIYNGPSTSAALIGTYSGNTLPPVIVSTHASGKLTLQFTTDNSVIYNGWVASVSCVNFTPPTITAFTPSSAVAGSEVIITGTNFLDVTAVKFSKVSASFTINSSTQITAVVPGSTPSGKISVTAPAGTATSTGVFTFIISAFSAVSTPALANVQNGDITWGDYDNDNDLDILLTGKDKNQISVTKIYTNNAGVFTDLNANLPGVSGGSAIWGDYDNDNDLDILLTGTTNDGLGISRIYKNINGIFSDANAGLAGIFAGMAVWADIDNDGDQDVLLAGTTDPSEPITRIYILENGIYTPAASSLTDVTNGSISLGDYDNDGDLDILLTGTSTSGDIATIYQNTAGTFSAIQTDNITGNSGGSVAWGDYDMDGDLDILITGTNGTFIYVNTQGKFTNIQAGLPAAEHGKAAWGDYDNDGDLDFILSGNTSGILIYKNANGVFNQTETINLPTLTNIAISWGDYDNDKDLDILVSGANNNNTITKLFRNNSNSLNTKASPPTQLNASLQDNTVTLTWNKATDNQTPQNGLTYNVRVGTTSGGAQIVSCLSSVNTGQRRLMGQGNSGQRNSFILNNLPAGTYYWSVQAIDNSFIGSVFATEGTFTIKATAQLALENLTHTYNGTTRQATVVTTPASLPVTVTYNGSLTPPVQAGSYKVVATVNTAAYQGSISGTLVINKANAQLSLSSLTHTFSNSAKQASATTLPTGKTVDITYNGTSELPVNAGTYTVEAVISDANYSGTTTGILVINKAQATVIISNLIYIYDGSAKTASATTIPSGLTLRTIYGSKAESPVQAGTYAVVGSIEDENYEGSAASILKILKAKQTLTFEKLEDTKYGDEIILKAVSSSALPVNYQVVTGPATVSGTTLQTTGVGQVIVRAIQTGNTNFAAAEPVEQRFVVAKASQAISFAAVSGTVSEKNTITLQASATSGLPVELSIVSGPAKLQGNVLSFTGAGQVMVQASQRGNAVFETAAVEQTILVKSAPKAEQSIVFTSITEPTFGDEPIKLSAKASSALPVTFKVVSGPAVISGNSLMLTGAGEVTIQAFQTGNDSFLPVASQEQKFCVKPAKPTITQQGSETGSFVLTSSSKAGNQWIKNGEIIEGATSQQYEVKETGIYAVQVTINSCNNTSVQVSLTAENEPEVRMHIQVYPNPATEKVFVEYQAATPSQEVIISIFNAVGIKVAEKTISGNNGSKTELMVSHLAQGTYYVQIADNKHITTKTFIKM